MEITGQDRLANRRHRQVPREATAHQLAGNVYERYDGDIDFFLVYVDELEELYLVEESEAGSHMQLRVEEPERRDPSINWAEEYEFDENWPP